MTNQGIAFEHVPIVTPDGATELVKDLSFSIKAGEHLMITGPNGCGKTSILRVLAGLWPLFEGNIKRPEVGLDHIMYVPQRPYFTYGTLRDQIVYPHSHEDMLSSGYSDKDLDEILKLVHLAYLPGREGGFDVQKEWKDVFSGTICVTQGGEKQRMQLARVFYHCPKFVVLDEATSAVSNDVEALMYGTAKAQGITFVTVSHRPNLFKFHQFLLRIGKGSDPNSWTLETIGNNESLKMSIDHEIKVIQEKIQKENELRERLVEINRKLA